MAAFFCIVNVDVLSGYATIRVSTGSGTLPPTVAEKMAAAG
jgi:hypothetical protein